MRIKPADVPQWTQFYAILGTPLKIRATMMNWTNEHAHKYIGNNYRKSGVMAFYQKKKRDSNSLPVWEVVTDRLLWIVFCVH